MGSSGEEVRVGEERRGGEQREGRRENREGGILVESRLDTGNRNETIKVRRSEQIILMELCVPKVAPVNYN